MARDFGTAVGSEELATSRTRGCDQGFILVPVLVVVGLLALIAMIGSRTTNLDLKISAYQATRSEAEFIADGIARLAIANIMLNGPVNALSGNVRVDGTPISCAIGGARASFSITDAAGQVDINAAPKDLLDELLRGVGIDSDEAGRLASAIVDFRDADDLTELGTSEIEAYRAAGLPYGPKNAPFEGVDELDQVLGMTPALFARLRDFLTVHSNRTTIDPDVANTELRSIQWPRRFVARGPSQTFLVRAEVQISKTVIFRRQTIVDLLPRSAAGFVIKEWGQFENRLVSAGHELPVTSCFDVFAH